MQLSLSDLICALSPSDTFAVGLGFDFFGAYLLGRGLLTTPKELARRTKESQNSFAAWFLRDLEDRVDGEFGIGALLLGFAIQAVGYALVVGGVSGGAGGLKGAFLAIALTVFAAALVFVVWRLARFRRLAHLLSEFASYDESGVRRKHPHAGELVRYGRILGFEPQLGEFEPGNEAAYPYRVFGIDAVRTIDGATHEWVVRRASQG